MWFLQAALVGGVTATIVDLQTRRLLPLATLFGLSLAFPGPAPSRLSIAVGAGTVRNREQYVHDRMEIGLSDDPVQAATEAITLITVLGTHQRLSSGATERITSHAGLIAAELGVDDREQEKLTWSMLLHDVGMSTLPAAILDKPGTLTEDEQKVFQTHTAAGESFVAPLADWLGSWRFATSQHHEHWDGTGFPKGIGGERITLSARIVSVVDAYEAVISKGTASATSEKAVAEILAASGTSFDPAVVQALRTVAPTTAAATGGARPGVAISAVQGAAVLIAAAAMAAIAAPAPITLALDSDIAASAPASETSTTLPVDIVAPAPNGRSTTTTRSVDDANLTSGDASKLTTTTAAPETSTTDGSSSTTAPTTTIPVTSTTTTPATTAAPRDTATTTTVVELITTTTTTAAPTTTTPAGPSAVADVVYARQDRNKRIDVLANDSIGPSGSAIDVTTLTVLVGPDFGIAEIKNGQVRYRSNADHLGEDTLTYMICNEQGTCSTAKVTITVG